MLSNIIYALFDIDLRKIKVEKEAVMEKGQPNAREHL